MVLAVLILTEKTSSSLTYSTLLNKTDNKPRWITGREFEPSKKVLAHQDLHGVPFLHPLLKKCSSFPQCESSWGNVGTKGQLANFSLIYAKGFVKQERIYPMPRPFFRRNIFFSFLFFYAADALLCSFILPPSTFVIKSFGIYAQRTIANICWLVSIYRENR